METVTGSVFREEGGSSSWSTAGSGSGSGSGSVVDMGLSLGLSLEISLCCRFILGLDDVFDGGIVLNDSHCEGRSAHPKSIINELDEKDPPSTAASVQ